VEKESWSVEFERRADKDLVYCPVVASTIADVATS
jgi:hypothetical protein